MRLIVGSIPSDSDNESSAIELLKQADLEEGLEQIRERARAEGREEGALQAMQQIAIKIVALRFPDLEQFARTTIATISSLKRLELLVVVLSILTSQEDAEQFLHSLVSAT